MLLIRPSAVGTDSDPQPAGIVSCGMAFQTEETRPSSSKACVQTN